MLLFSHTVLWQKSKVALSSGEEPICFDFVDGMKAFVKNFNFRSVILRRALVEMAAKAGQGARLKPEVDGKMLLVRKRTRKDLDHYSESTGGDSLTDCETCSSGSSSSSSSSFRTDDTYDYDDSSRGIYSKSEYYYSSENTRWANDIDSDYDESSWRASTGKGFFWVSYNKVPCLTHNLVNHV